MGAKMDDYYRMEGSPKADRDQIVAGQNYRISVLTSRLLRLEYSEDGEFEDRATQIVLNRNFGKTEFRTEEKKGVLFLFTGDLILEYDQKPFDGGGLCVRMPKNPYTQHAVWNYGEVPETLPGTARTLDEADGEIPLEAGILSPKGYTLLDDSRSLILQEDGWIAPAGKDRIDLYFFGYGRNYKECLKDYYRLTGSTPLLPRFALGNWWSRYYTYSSDSYLALMNRFEEEGIPFSVAVLDMDWHLVDLDPKYGSGWTGYTWNRELFPDPEGFMNELHRRGLKVTLNVHPAEGVRAHEEAYPAMARALGVDYERETPIAFEIEDPEFLKAYFRYLHHPREEEGVDFWWIDWQQGSRTKQEGLDPLWMLNHFHYLDNARNGLRPLIFSRYAGPGSHRYPTGFSGDTIITWKSLAFQPYFTACASNIGYGWWSHDIGGHMRGIRDDELAVRWLQFGVFSPIMRLHSSKNEFTGKEPWNYGEAQCRIMKEFLRLRHRLIPYLYTMNRRCSEDGLPLICPLYYEEPDRAEAYLAPCEYYFGSGLLVHPVTEKMDPELMAGCTKTWIPEGIWYDLFDGLRYRGGRWLKLYRGLDSLPVLAKAGGIVPLAGPECAASANKSGNPETLELIICLGEDGNFVLYEDDGESMDYRSGKFAQTEFILDQAGGSFRIEPAAGDYCVIPESRDYILRFMGAEKDGIRSVAVNGASLSGFRTEYDKGKRMLTISINGVKPSDEVEAVFEDWIEAKEYDTKQRCFERLNRAQISYDGKERIYRLISGGTDTGRLVSELQAMEIPDGIRNEIYEVVFA